MSKRQSLLQCFGSCITLIVLGGAVGVGQLKRDKLRHSHRITTSLPADVLDENGYMYSGVLTDYSDAGAGMKLSASGSFNMGDRVPISLGARSTTV